MNDITTEAERMRRAVNNLISAAQDLYIIATPNAVAAGEAIDALLVNYNLPTQHDGPPQS